MCECVPRDHWPVECRGWKCYMKYIDANIMYGYISIYCHQYVMFMHSIVLDAGRHWWSAHILDIGMKIRILFHGFSGRYYLG